MLLIRTIIFRLNYVTLLLNFTLYKVRLKSTEVKLGFEKCYFMLLAWVRVWKGIPFHAADYHQGNISLGLREYLPVNFRSRP